MCLLWGLACLLCFFPSCTPQSNLPKSAGQPGEVLLVADTADIVADALGADADGLPQPEPMFDVKPCTMAQFNAVTRLERNIVVVNINAALFTHTAVRYERNVYATPQIIVYINTPSAYSLRRDIGHSPITQLLQQNELAAFAQRLERQHEPAIEQELAHTFGVSIRVPKGMTVNKRGRHFVWLSDNNPAKMGNICLYTAENRDSVMRLNLKGETDSMYMATVPGTVKTQKGTAHDGTAVTIRRGLWQMTGDAMGGPFVSRAMHWQTHGKVGHTVVAEAFVFAPGEKKRDKMRMLEACLHTMQPVVKGNCNNIN